MVKTNEKLYLLTEEQLVTGRLTLARCSRCGGSGSYSDTVLSLEGDDLTETTREFACDCRRRPAELMQRASLPDGRFDGLTLADLDWQRVEPPEVAAAVQDYAQRLEAYVASGVGLVLAGNVGTGKTHVAVGLVKLACGLGIEARFLTMSDLLGRIKATYDRNGAEHRRFGREREADVMDDLAGVTLLALDDLGTEKPTEWVRDRLYTLVNRRYVDNRPTIATTNLTLEELADRLGERTISRLWGTSLALKFQGADYREQVKRRTLRRVRGASPVAPSDR